MVDYNSEPQICHCVHNLGYQHHDTHAADSKPDLIRIKISELAYQVSLHLNDELP